MVIGVIAATSVGALWLRHLPKSDSLEIASEYLAFGDVWEQREFRWTLPVKNTSSESVEIADVEMSCGCRSLVEPKPLIIPAGEVRDLRLVLDLTDRGAEAARAPYRPFAVKLHPIIKSRLPRSLMWTVHGKVRNVFRELPRSISFEEPCVQGTRFPSKVFRVSTHFGIDDLTADCPSAEALCEVHRVAEGDREFTVKITPSSGLPVGPFAFSLGLAAVGAGGEDLPRMEIDVFGEVAHDVGAVPSVVLFAAVDVGRTVRQGVRLRSLTGSDFSIEATECGSGNIEVKANDRGSDSDGESMFEVILHKAREGLQRSHVRFRVSEHGGEYVVEVPVLYHGVAP